MGLSGQFLRVPWNFKIFHDRLGPERILILGNARKSHYGLKFGGMMQCTMKWMATVSQCSHLLSRPAEGAVILWTSCFVWIKHEDMFLCTGRVNTNYNWIELLHVLDASCEPWTPGLRNTYSLPTTVCSMAKITRPWSIHQKRVGTSRTSQHTAHSNERSRWQSLLLGCLYLALAYR